MFGRSSEVVTIDLLSGFMSIELGRPSREGLVWKQARIGGGEKHSINSIKLSRLASSSRWFAQRRAAVLHIMHA
jgi:hypothetical protein